MTDRRHRYTGNGREGSKPRSEAGDSSFRDSNLYVRDSDAVASPQAEIHRLATLGALTLGIGHDLINATIAMEMSAGQARRASSLDAAGEALSRVEDTSRRCRRIVESMIDLVAHGVLETRQASLLAAVRKAVDTVRTNGDDDALDVEVRQEAVVDFNPIALEVVFTNLIRNSAQACDGPCKVEIEAEMDDTAGICRIRCRDFGPGFSAEHLDRVFDMLFSTHSNARRHGIGLALVRQLVNSQGGEVRASNHPDGGALVVIDLPQRSRAAG